VIAGLASGGEEDSWAESHSGQVAQAAAKIIEMRMLWRGFTISSSP